MEFGLFSNGERGNAVARTTYGEDLDDRAALLAFVLILIGTPMQIMGYLLNG